MHHLRRLKATAKKVTHRERSPVPSAINADAPGEASTNGPVQGIISYTERHDDEVFQPAAHPHIDGETHQYSDPPPPGSHVEAINGAVNVTSPPSVPEPPIQSGASDCQVGVGMLGLEGQTDLWGQAFGGLSETQKARLSALGTTSNSTAPLAPTTASVIPDWIAVTKQKRDECEKKFWRVNGKSPGDDIILRDQASQIISWLTTAGDIGVQFAPSIVAQVWPVVKALLKVPVQEADQMAAVLKVAEKIARLAVRGAVYEASFTSTNTPANALASLHASLLALYTASLALLSTASRLLDSNLVKRTVHAILQPESVKTDVGASLAELEQRLALDVQAAESARFSGIAHELRLLHRPIIRMDERVGNILESIHESEEHRILDWISPVLYSTHHDLVSDSRMLDTCNWILQHPEFEEWQNSSASALMWLRGSVGTGKTFLTSKVIDHQKMRLESGFNDEAMAFFYFNRNESRNSTLSCLQSLVRQFSTCYKRSGYIRPTLRNLYNHCRFNARTLSQELCKSQLLESLNLFPRSTIVLDALDECDEGRHELIMILDFLMKSSHRPLKVFVSARPDGDIRDAFHERASVVIGVGDNHHDIERYIKEKVKNHRKWAKFSSKTKDTVVRTLTEKSQAMFRWTALQIHQLMQLLLEDEVIARLGRLPKDLEQAYDDIYTDQIKSRGEIQTGIAERAIIWALGSLRPVRSSYLLSAVRVDACRYYDTVLQRSTIASPGRPEYVTGEVDDDVILELCANLLTLNSEGRWIFPHASVSEYFEARHFSRAYAHAYVGFASLILLIDVPQERFMCEEGKGPFYCYPYITTLLPKISVLGLYPGAGYNSSNGWDGAVFLSTTGSCEPSRPLTFAAYAMRYWGQHVAWVDRRCGSTFMQETNRGEHACGTPNGLSLVLQRFLGHPNNSSTAYRLWCTAYYEDDNYDRDAIDYLAQRECYDRQTEGFASLAIVHFGLLNLLTEWWPKPPTSHACDSASHQPSTLPVIDITMRTRHGWTLLHMATAFRHAPIVNALIRAGANANDTMQRGQDDTGRPVGPKLSPMSLACSSGLMEFCQILSKHCDLDLPLERGNPLYCAVASKHADVVQFLLTAGANSCCDIIMEGPHYDKGDDHYKAVAQYETVFAVAAQHGDISMLRMLVENITASDILHETLQNVLGNAALFAAFSSNLDALRYLILDVHVDPNTRYTARGYRTGAYDGVSAPSLTFRDTIVVAAAQNASELWNDDVIDCLKECGSDIILKDHELQRLQEYYPKEHKLSIIEAAILRGKVEVVRMAVEQWGQDVNALTENGKYGSALVAAARHSEGRGAGVQEEALEVLRYVLDQGADPNLQVPDGQYHNAIIAFIEGTWAGGSVHCTLDVLLEFGADINLPVEHGRFGSALAAAVAPHRPKQLVEALIKAGANINQRLEYGDHGTALIAAAAVYCRGSWGTENIRCLLEHGADVNIIATRGEHSSALMTAATKGCNDWVQMFLDYGANVNLGSDLDKYGSALIAAIGTPWHRTRESDKVPTIKLLLDHGADVNFVTAQGMYASALMAASAWGREETATILIAAGADVHRPENHGWKELLRARTEKRMEADKFWITPEEESRGSQW